MDLIMYGIFQLSVWGYVGVTLGLVQTTIFSVTLYLHRSQAHRACEFHPILVHFFRFWLWLTTSMLTDQWVAVHRYHHARVETEQDPHSPWVHGIWKVLLKGVWLYSEAAQNKALVQKYSHGSPRDWIERNIYQQYQSLGLVLMLLLDVMCFGIGGFVVWGVQMLWIPIHAAGVINGLGHYIGYRNYQTQDRSTNITAWGLWIGGEELHNNHHAFPEAAKFSSQWYEFDIGYAVLKTLSLVGLARIKRLPPELTSATIAASKTNLSRWKLLVANRLRVLDRYQHMVVAPTLKLHFSAIKEKGMSINACLKQMVQSRTLLSREDYDALMIMLGQSKTLIRTRLLYDRLEEICHKTKVGQKGMQQALKQWCLEAKKSGVEALMNYSEWLEKTFFVEETSAFVAG